MANVADEIRLDPKRFKDLNTIEGINRMERFHVGDIDTNLHVHVVFIILRETVYLNHVCINGSFGLITNF